MQESSSFNTYIFKYIADINNDISVNNPKHLQFKEFGFVFTTMMDTNTNVEIEKSSDILQLHSMSSIVKQYSKITDIINILLKASEQTKSYIKLLNTKYNTIKREQRTKIDYLYEYSAILFIIKMLSQMLIAIQYIIIFLDVRNRLLKQKHPRLLDPKFFIKKWPNVNRESIYSFGQENYQKLLDPIVYMKQWPKNNIENEYISGINDIEYKQNQQDIVSDTSKRSKITTLLQELRKKINSLGNIYSGLESDIDKINTAIVETTSDTNSNDFIDNVRHIETKLKNTLHTIKRNIYNNIRSCTTYECIPTFIDKLTLIDSIVSLIDNLNNIKSEDLIQLSNLKKEVIHLRMFKEAYYALSSIFMNKVFEILKA